MPANRLLLALSLALTAACQGSDKGTGDGDEAGAAALKVYPDVGGQGTSLQVELETSSAFFTGEGEATADFGPGVVVDTLDITGGFTALANVTVEPDADLGLRDVSVAQDGNSLGVLNGFEVISQSFQIEPDSGRMGETLDVVFLGHNTGWESGVTFPSFGDNIEVLSFTVLSETLAEASVAVGLDAAPGWRDVRVGNGEDAVTLYDGFKVDRVGLTATFDPDVAEQGDTVDFTVYGRDTNFSEDTTIAFFDPWGENPDIVVDNITVLDAENLYGRMTLSNAATLGLRDVLLTTGDEGVLIPDAFEVIGGDLDLGDVAISLSFYVTRAVDNTTGDIYESVVAVCAFALPLDPACPPDPEDDGAECTDGDDNDNDGYIDCLDSDCGSSGVCPGPSPYDVNVTVESPGNGEVDCPSPRTVGAGDFVWLESDANVVTLERVEDTSSGQIYYYGFDLTLDDYVPDTWYDLHTEGEEGGVEEVVLDRVLPTVPSDWTLLSPPLWGNYTHNRAEDFVFDWTPALTYPDAIFSASLGGTLVATGTSGAIASLPWDDGEHTFTTDQLAELDAGGATFTAYSFIEGPEFGLPDSIYQSNTAKSYIYLQGSLVLE